MDATTNHSTSRSKAHSNSTMQRGPRPTTTKWNFQGGWNALVLEPKWSTRDLHQKWPTCYMQHECLLQKIWHTGTTLEFGQFNVREHCYGHCFRWLVIALGGVPKQIKVKACAQCYSYRTGDRYTSNMDFWKKKSFFPIISPGNSVGLGE